VTRTTEAKSKSGCCRVDMEQVVGVVNGVRTFSRLVTVRTRTSLGPLRGGHQSKDNFIKS